MITPEGLREPAIQRLRAVRGVAVGRNQVQGAPSSMRCRGVAGLAVGDHHAAAGSQRRLGGVELGHHAAAAVAWLGVAGHGLDLGRDAGDLGNHGCARVRARIGGVDAVYVREQDQGVGADHGGDAGAQAVVVADADLVGGNRVVLVDQGHGAEPKQGF